MLTHWAGLTGFQQTEFGMMVTLRETHTRKTARTENDIKIMRIDDPDAEFEWETHLQYKGEYEETEDDRTCPRCGAVMTPKGYAPVTLKHSPNRRHKTLIHVKRRRMLCPCCGCRPAVQLPFQADGHFITRQLEKDIELLCRLGFTQKEIEQITDVDRHTIKDIDKRRLEETYKDRDKQQSPPHQARIIGIDEFSLHKGHRYATLFMDMETGEVLYVVRGKKEDVVYQFIDYVGRHWMSHVKAVCCDMNAGFANAFLEKCPHLEIVYDRFHIIKNFNEMVLTEVRKDVERELKEKGDKDGAKALKRSKYILLAKRTTLEELDRKAEERRAGNTAQGKDTLWSNEEEKSHGTVQ